MIIPGSNNKSPLRDSNSGGMDQKSNTLFSRLWRRLNVLVHKIVLIKHFHKISRFYIHLSPKPPTHPISNSWFPFYKRHIYKSFLKAWIEHPCRCLNTRWSHRHWCFNKPFRTQTWVKLMFSYENKSKADNIKSVKNTYRK